jgi:Secretion system C-terminal sorting domain
MIQSLQSAQSNKSVIQTMDGPAVYKARTLYAYYEPDKQYDDRVICLISNGNRNAYQITSSNYDSIMFEADSKAMGVTVADRFAKIKTTDHEANDDAEESKIIETKIYPNPSNDKLNIAKECANGGELEIYNAIGQLILNYSLHQGQSLEQINTTGLLEGMYVLKVRLLNCATTTFKLQIKH